MISRGRYLFGVLRAFFAFLSMKRGVLVDKSQKTCYLSMKRAVFVDTRVKLWHPLTKTYNFYGRIMSDSQDALPDQQT